MDLWTLFNIVALFFTLAPFYINPMVELCCSDLSLGSFIIFKIQTYLYSEYFLVVISLKLPAIWIVNSI